ARIILETALGYSPPSPQLEGYVYFGKIPCPHISLEGALDIFEIPGCICPPFHLADIPTAFFTTLGVDEEEAEEKFNNCSEKIYELLGA
ncbi:MAG: hypothetical protein ACFFCQ_02365, partial [Promethearchaeota archaeon]